MKEKVQSERMEFNLPDQVKNILDKFSKANYQIYIVGGAVRDLLMDREVKNWDFTTDAKPEEILKILPEGFYDNKFGTVGISVDDQIYEITTMRREGKYEDFRHPSAIAWTNKIEEDLARRDFTINAMAIRAAPFILIDPFDGQSDIKDKLIRAVGDPTNRFKEDALRLVRAIRIATELGFDIESDTFSAIQDNADLIMEVSYERIRDELIKLLASSNPYIGIKNLREAGILQIILPELESCFGIVQKGEKKARSYDIGEHCLLTLKHIPSQEPIVRLAALLHDVGKVPTFKKDNGNVTFYGHDVVGGEIVLKIANRLRLSKKQKDKVFKLVRFHLFTVDERQTDSAIRRFIRNVEVENLDDMFALREGDRLGGGTQNPTSWRLEKFKERVEHLLQKPFSLSDLKVSGHDVMQTLNIPPSKKVGEILNNLFEEVLEDASKNNRQYLLERIKLLNKQYT